MAVRSKKINTTPDHDPRRAKDLTRDYGGVTAKELTMYDETFKAACQRAEVKPTKRQASKFRRGFGLAYLRRSA
jgi:hypothetical protein